MEVVQVLDSVNKVDGGGEVGGLLCWQGSVFLFVTEVGVVQVLDSVSNVDGQVWWWCVVRSCGLGVFLL